MPLARASGRARRAPAPSRTCGRGHDGRGHGAGLADLEREARHDAVEDVVGERKRRRIPSSPAPADLRPAEALKQVNHAQDPRRIRPWPTTGGSEPAGAVAAEPVRIPAPGRLPWRPRRSTSLLSTPPRWACALVGAGALMVWWSGCPHASTASWADGSASARALDAPTGHDRFRRRRRWPRRGSRARGQEPLCSSYSPSITFD